jgi:hypothetical protein
MACLQHAGETSNFFLYRHYIPNGMIKAVLQMNTVLSCNWRLMLRLTTNQDIGCALTVLLEKLRVCLNHSTRNEMSVEKNVDVNFRHAGGTRCELNRIFENISFIIIDP